VRDIKFRVWKEGEKVRPVNLWFFKEKDILDVDDLDRDGYVLMQYTGLKDVHGTEIYECDICRQTFNHKTTVGRVTINPTQGVKVGIEPIWPHDVIVIGNVYDNPELLLPAVAETVV